MKTNLIITMLVAVVACCLYFIYDSVPQTIEPIKVPTCGFHIDVNDSNFWYEVNLYTMTDNGLEPSDNIQIQGSCFIVLEGDEVRISWDADLDLWNQRNQ